MSQSNRKRRNEIWYLEAEMGEMQRWNKALAIKSETNTGVTPEWLPEDNGNSALFCSLPVRAEYIKHMLLLKQEFWLD